MERKRADSQGNRRDGEAVTGPKAVITRLDFRNQHTCFHCWRDAAIRAELTMRGGSTHERRLCWHCLQRVFNSLDMIESFLPAPITADLPKQGTDPGDEDIPF